MKNELKEFYTETFLMGEMLFNFFKKGHPCYPLANFIAKNYVDYENRAIPDIDFVSYSLSLSQAEIERQLAMMKSAMDEYAYGISKKKSFEGQAPLFMKSVYTTFLTRSESGKLISFKVDEPIILNVGDEMVVNMFFAHFPDDIYIISQKICKVEYSRTTYMYFLKPGELPEE